MDRHQPVPQPPAVQRTSELAAHHTHVSISLVAGCTRELASAHIPSDWHPTREEWPAVTKPRPTNRARKRPQQYGKPAPGIALEDAALARVASRAPRCGLHAACVPTRASQSRSVQAPPYHHLDRRSSPPDNDAAAKAFSGLLVTPRTPSGLVLSLSLLLVYFHVWVWPSLCPATWLAHHRKNKKENGVHRQESDGLHRRGLDPEDSARKPENLLAFAAMAAQVSAGWTAPAPPDANTFRVFISTDNHLGFAEVRAGRPRRTAAAPSRLCAAAGSREVRKAPLALTDASAAES